MKKLIALILVFTLLFTLAGCGGSEAAPSGGRSEATSSGEAQRSGTSSSSSSAAPVAPSTSQTGTPEQEKTEEPDTDNNDSVSPFAPNPALAGAATVTTDKEVYALGEEVLVTVTIHMPEVFSDGINFGIFDPARGDHVYRIGTGIEDIGNREMIERDFKGRDKAGQYEVRLYATYRGEDCNEENLVAVIPITVSDTSFVPDSPFTPIPPVVKPPLESHSGDAEYFYVTSEDYMVTMAQVTLDDGIDENGVKTLSLPVKRYYVFSFGEDGYCTNVCYKVVYENTGTATNTSAEDKSVVAVIGNVAYYGDNCPQDFIGDTREQLARSGYVDGIM